MHGGVVRQDTKTVAPLSDERVRRGEAPIDSEVCLPAMITRARNVAGVFVERFDFAAIARRGTGVDQLCDLRDLVQGDQTIPARRALEMPCRRPFLTTRAGAAGVDPSLPATIQHRDCRVPHVAQHPPQARGDHATAIVIGHYALASRDA